MADSRSRVSSVRGSSAVTREMVSSMIDRALGSAPSQVLLDETIAAFRLQLKAHFVNLMYEMRAACETEGELDAAQWRRIVASVAAWDEEVRAKQLARLRDELLHAIGRHERPPSRMFPRGGRAAA